jgi:hypothetical protein
MRIELLPVLFGLVVALIGGAVIYDASGDPESGPLRDRRRRIRASIDRFGEQMVGLGTFLLGVALIGRDSWRFGTLIILSGTLLVVLGGFRNRRYIKEILTFRGAARRGIGDPVEQSNEKPRRTRIR